MNIAAEAVANKGNTLHALLRVVAMTIPLWILTGCADVPLAPVRQVTIQTKFPRVVVSGVAQNIDLFYSTNPDCTSKGIPVVRITVTPAHGTLVSEQGDDYTAFAKDDQRYECNKHKTPLTRLIYQSTPGYVGTDTAQVEVFFPMGGYRNSTYNITVK